MERQHIIFISITSLLNKEDVCFAQYCTAHLAFHVFLLKKYKLTLLDTLIQCIGIQFSSFDMNSTFTLF